MSTANFDKHLVLKIYDHHHLSFFGSSYSKRTLIYKLLSWSGIVFDRHWTIHILLQWCSQLKVLKLFPFVHSRIFMRVVAVQFMTSVLVFSLIIAFSANLFTAQKCPIGQIYHLANWIKQTRKTICHHSKTR